MATTPLPELTPKLPDGLHFPFYYASIQCLWVFWETSLDAAEAALGRAADFDTRLTPTRFRGADGGECAGALLNFQRYTGHLPNALATTNEVEFNLICTPRSAVTTPCMTLADYMRGEDQTGTVGQLRLHVAADNQFAVMAGREGFGENKFYTLFDYTAPTLNDPKLVAENASYPQSWRTALYRPDQFTDGKFGPEPKADQRDSFLYDLTANLNGLATVPVTATPITEYALGLGRTVVTRWTLLGTFNYAPLSETDARRVAFTLGPPQPEGASDFVKMRTDLEDLIAGRAPCGVQSFDSPPACIEPPGWFLDA
jgi:hypothetical protein